jgi:hypothetical protein
MLLTTLLVTGTAAVAPALQAHAQTWALAIAQGVAGNVVTHFGQSQLARLMAANHDLEKALHAAVRLTVKAMTPTGVPGQDADSAYTVDLVSRLGLSVEFAEAYPFYLRPFKAGRAQKREELPDPFLIDPHPLLGAYYSGEMSDIAQVLEALIPDGTQQHPRANRALICTEVAYKFHYSFNEVLKQPHHARAQTAFVREMLFEMRRSLDGQAEAFDPDQLAKDIALELTRAMDAKRVQLAEEDRAQIDGLVSSLLRVEALVKALTTDRMPRIRRPTAVQEPENLELSQRLAYVERLCKKLHGRPSELNQLHHFLDSDAIISWAVLYGEGGTGKSRLCLELLRETEGKWAGGFVEMPPGVQADPYYLLDPKAFSSWRPEQPTLFIIDYAELKVPAVAEIIRILKDNKPSLQHPIRFLFIERYWNTQFFFAQILLKNDLSDCMHRFKMSSDQAPCALKLKDTDESSFLSIFTETYANLTGKQMSEHAISFAEAHFRAQKQSQLKRTPLIAGILAAICAQHSDEHAKSLEQTLIDNSLRPFEIFFKFELERWEKLKASECDLNIVHLATIKGGLKEEEFDMFFTEGQRDLFGNDWETAKKICHYGSSETGDHAVKPLVPDPIGEEFVLQRQNGELRLSYLNSSRERVKNMAERVGISFAKHAASKIKKRRVK